MLLARVALVCYTYEMNFFDSCAQESIDCSTDEALLKQYSRDTSIFVRTPRGVIFPKNKAEVSRLITLAHEARARGELVSLTGWSAGTDMTGGPLTDSYVLSFTKYMNHVSARGETAEVEPGCYYRDFEKATLQSGNYILPSYPASRELCALGGIISNDSGGELTLQYGKTHDYINELEVVLSDGSEARFGPLSRSELAQKQKLQTLEGDIYRKMYTLVTQNAATIALNTPTVSKNSAGYALWRIHDRARDTFDLAQLIVGSQGTLAMVTNAHLRLIQLKKHRCMMVVFMKNLDTLPEVVKRVLSQSPESFESYDDHTFSLAVQFLPQMIGQMGFWGASKLGISFLPEVWTVLTGGVPKLVLMAEFAEESAEEARSKAKTAIALLRDLPVRSRLAGDEAHSQKYWKIRRESFALLRKNLKGMYATPFIDDFVVHPEDYPSFLPKLNAILQEYQLTYTIAGHVGDGNFHIIPLMDLSDPKVRRTIVELSPKVYELVAQYHGSITGEHNDGIIRTPYLPTMFTPDMIRLFEETKRIFDPHNLFNPGKKVAGALADIERFMVRSV